MHLCKYKRKSTNTLIFNIVKTFLYLEYIPLYVWEDIEKERVAKYKK